MLNLLKRPRPAQPNEVEIKIPPDAPRPAPAMPNRAERRNAAKKSKGKGQPRPQYITQEQYDAAYAEHRALKDLWMAQEATLRVNRTINRFLIGAMLVETALTIGMAVALAMR